ncbi:MAG: NFACT RNA binding domain-containing protein [Helicobacteraceae bacterium]|jgi:predicted ribosome quality control (RQC) complex YloA/Tae2 family protein|nr:NFACT RNA binding domain-containing protein [Helicobacteraceae bacterium]
MKLSHLRQIVDYMQGLKHINAIHRIGDSVIKIVFDRDNVFYFNMQKGNAYISKCSKEIGRSKVYNAPFDVILSKRFNRAQIDSVELYNGDKIMRIKASISGAYKAQSTLLQLEFTGKTTNAIILDEDEIILEALRHVDAYSSYRIIKVGQELVAPPALPFTPKEYPLEDVEAFLLETCDQEQAQRLNALKKQKSAFITKKLQKLERLYAKLDDEVVLKEEVERLQHYGNLVLSNLHNIKPYQSVLALTDYDGTKIEVEVDSKISVPSRYSDYLFKRAKKSKQKVRNLHIERESLAGKINHLKHFLAVVENAKDVASINLLFPPRQQMKKEKPNESYEVFWVEGYKVLLGKSEKGNIDLLENSRAKDIWFHMRDRPSAHVIVVTDKKNIPESVIHEAAGLCVDFTMFENGTYLVDYTQRRNVKIQDGANVHYIDYKTVDIEKY